MPENHSGPSTPELGPTALYPARDREQNPLFALAGVPPRSPHADAAPAPHPADRVGGTDPRRHPSAIEALAAALAARQRADRGELSRRELDARLWNAGVLAARADGGRWITAGDRVILARWPELTRLPLERGHLRVLAALAQSSMPLGALAIVSGVPLEQLRPLVGVFAVMGVARVAPSGRAGAPGGRRGAQPSSTPSQ